MARLDRFLQALATHGGDSLRLVAGQPVRMERHGKLSPVSRETLDDAQITALLRELAPPDVVPDLDQRSRVAFTYHGPAGPVVVEVHPENGASAAVLRPTVGQGGQPAGLSPEALTSAREHLTGLLSRLAETGASDLHLRTGEPPLLRQDGDLVRMEAPALERDGLETMLLSIMPEEIARQWRETWDADWAWEMEGVARFRCNAGQDRRGPMAVFRRIPSVVPSAEDLGLSSEVQRLCHLTKGLVLVTGPTGSGKSTTLAAMIDLVNQSRTDHVLTIEDPIDFVHAGKRALVTQRQVGMHTRSFASALRAALREDPDVVLVGELRDLETIGIALETAETGHLVFGTLHTTTASGTLDRIIDQFPPEQQSQVRVMLAESLRGVVAQVLCKKIGGGRVAAREILISTHAVSNLIREGKTFQIPSIIQTNRRAGMVALNDALLDLVGNGLIEPREAYLKAADKQGITAGLKSRGHDTSFLGEA